METAVVMVEHDVVTGRAEKLSVLLSRSNTLDGVAFEQLRGDRQADKVVEQRHPEVEAAIPQHQTGSRSHRLFSRKATQRLKRLQCREPFNEAGAHLTDVGRRPPL